MSQVLKKGSTFETTAHLTAGMPRIYLGALTLLNFFDKDVLCRSSPSACDGMLSESPPVLSKQSKSCSAQTSPHGSIAQSDWIFSSIRWLEAANNDIHDMLPDSPGAAIIVMIEDSRGSPKQSTTPLNWGFAGECCESLVMPIIV